MPFRVQASWVTSIFRWQGSWSCNCLCHLSHLYQRTVTLEPTRSHGFETVIFAQWRKNSECAQKRSELNARFNNNVCIISLLMVGWEHIKRLKIKRLNLRGQQVERPKIETPNTARLKIKRPKFKRPLLGAIFPPKPPKPPPQYRNLGQIS